jgi:hypothetical protein
MTLNSRGPAGMSCLSPRSRKESWTQVSLIQIALIQLTTYSNFARSESPVFASQICPMGASAFEVPAAARSDSKWSGSGKWESGKFDPALKPPRLLTRVNSGRSVLYDTTFEHPANPVGCNDYTPVGKSKPIEFSMCLDAGCCRSVTLYFHEI